MDAGCDEVRVPGQRPDAAPSDTPNHEDARSITCAIQELVDRLVERLRPHLDALVDGTDLSPAHLAELVDWMVQAARRSMVRYITDGNRSIPFVDAVAPTFQAEVLSFAHGASYPQKKLQAWVTTNLSDDECRQYMQLSPEDQSSVDRSVEDARNLANKLVLLYEPVAKASARLLRHTNLELDDLEQESRIALRKAAIAFLPTSETSFVAYARTVIRNHLASFIRRSIGATEHAARCVEEFMDAKACLMRDETHRPSDDEVFDSLGWSDLRRNNVRAVLLLYSTQSLSSPSEEGAEVAVPSSCIDLSVDAANREFLSLLASVYSQLPPEEIEVLIYRYAHNMSFPALGRRFGYTERIIRSKHNAIIDRLRNDIQVAASASGPLRKPHEPGLFKWKERPA